MNTEFVSTNPKDDYPPLEHPEDIVTVTLYQAARIAVHESERWAEDAEFIAAAREDVPALLDALDDTEEEIKYVLSDWNDLCKAIGANKNGTAVGRAKMLVSERDTYKARCEALELAIKDDCNYCTHYKTRMPCSECFNIDYRPAWQFDEARFTE